MKRNHPNRGWRKRWTLDEPSMEARHEYGLIVRFVPNPAGGWEVDSPNGAEVIVTLAEAGEERPADRLHRLTDEAARLFARVLYARGNQT